VPSAAPPQPEPLTHGRVLVVFSGLLLAMLLAALDQTIVATALPTIVGELGGLERLSWVVTSYLLAQTVVTPLYGKLGDLYGRKGVMQGGIVLFLVGSMLCGASHAGAVASSFTGCNPNTGGNGPPQTASRCIEARLSRLISGPGSSSRMRACSLDSAGDSRTIGRGWPVNLPT